jgi:hypothetical protein
VPPQAAYAPSPWPSMASRSSIPLRDQTIGLPRGTYRLLYRKYVNLMQGSKD